MHILVVDDDADIRAILALVLDADGHEVETASDGAAALVRLRRGPLPSLILLDMMMPRLDGEDLLRELRRDPGTARIPVVILTGHPAARRKASELGAAGCLEKPVELQELLSTVHRAEVAPRAT